jgi:HEAT repeat protein
MGTESLIAALRDEDFTKLRWIAAISLVKIGDARAIEPLEAALQDKDSIVCGHAANALDKIRNAIAP